MDIFSGCAVSFKPSTDPLHFRRAFTLAELLVVIGIVAILASLLLPAMSKAKRKARMIEEMASARQLLIAAWMYADDQSDKVFPGYVADANARDDRGAPLSFPVNARYPWRLSPYLAHSFETIYCADNRRKLEDLRRLDRPRYVYSASVYPSLGINSYFIGGNETEFPAVEANRAFGAVAVVTRAGDIKAPDALMMFLSARSSVTGDNANGYYQVTPPATLGRQWAPEFSAALNPQEWGFAAPRYHLKAIGAKIDGHAEILNLVAMQDMRRWCNIATSANFTLTR